jgi:hypothetical protein
VIQGARDSPLIDALCDATIVVFSALLLTYDVVMPYSTCVSLASFVVHHTDAALDVTPELDTPPITGGVVSGGAWVVNVKSPDVARLPAASRDFTR